MTAAITSQEQLVRALEQLGRLYEALAALRREVEPIAEGHLEQIRRLQHEMDDYAGVLADARTSG